MSKSKKQYIEDAISYYKAQRYHEALAAFEQAILIDPNCVKALHGRGVIFASSKQYREAIESYEQASKLAPDVAKIHLDMAETFYAMQDFEKSGSSYREAIRLDSMNVDKYWQKQWELIRNALHFYSKRWDKEAIAAFQQILLFNPKNIQAPQYLSILQRTQAPIADSWVSSYNSDEPQHLIGQVGYSNRDNNQWDFSSSIHPANCRCAQCWEP